MADQADFSIHESHILYGQVKPENLVFNTEFAGICPTPSKLYLQLETSGFIE